jgi:beta-lactamase regulating signal transducer with metallopeptidase domain
MESYFIKSCFSLVVLYALYRVVLRYELDHQLNRVMGVVCILFSIVVPFVPVYHVAPSDQFPGVYAVVAGTADLQETVAASLPMRTFDIVLILYILGAAVCLFRCVFGLITLLRLYNRSPRRRQWGFIVVSLPRPISPFTFFNVLFIGNDHIPDSERETMLTHERVHRDQYHSVDTIFLEAVSVIFWFNPVVWLFKRDIRAEHEYYADACVLEDGVSPEDYQYLLFKARTGIQIEFGNYLSNKTSLIQRFTMMTKVRSNPTRSYWRVSLYLMLMSVIVFLGAFSGRRESQVDKIAVYEQGEAAMYQTLARRILYPVSARTENRSGIVNVSFTVSEKGVVDNIKAEIKKDGYPLREMVVVGYLDGMPGEAKGIDNTLKGAAIDAIKALGKFTPAQKDGKAVSCVLTLPIKFALRGSKDEQ